MKRLLHQLHQFLLRTLERTPSADVPSSGGAVKQPAFPAAESSTIAAAEDAASGLARLVQLEAAAAKQLLSQLKRHAYNDAQALSSSGGTTTAASAAHDVSDRLLRAELATLSFVHEQRALLLRCIHQLLAVAYDASAELHAVACGEVALLLQVRETEAPGGTRRWPASASVAVGCLSRSRDRAAACVAPRAAACSCAPRRPRLRPAAPAAAARRLRLRPVSLPSLPPLPPHPPPPARPPDVCHRCPVGMCARCRAVCRPGSWRWSRR